VNFFACVLLIYNFQFRSAFQPPSEYAVTGFTNFTFTFRSMTNFSFCDRELMRMGRRHAVFHLHHFANTDRLRWV